MNNQNKEYGLKSRSLGSEWENWNGRIEKNQGKLNVTPVLFLTLISLSTLLIIGIMSSFYYLFLSLLNHDFSVFIFWIYVGLTLLITTSYTLFLFTIISKKPLAFFLKDKQYSDSFVVKFTLFLGRKLGFSQDRLLNSMLQVGNILTKVLYSPVQREELLILTPRCLSKPIRQELNKIAINKGITCKVASGGSEARDILKETRPKAIIAVACERDLYAGVKDVPPQVPVIAIANARPEGPCRNTTVDLTELKEAIDFFNNNNN